jgi:tetratricopeptide (TPR) repeat protein
MASAPLTVKLRCASWKQLAGIYRRDLTRSALFLKTARPPPVGTAMRIDLTLPSETLIVLRGAVAEHVPPEGLDGRGPGVDVRLEVVPQSAMWLIESALSSARNEESAVAPAPAGRPPPRTPPGARTAKPDAQADASLDDGNDIAEAETDLVTALAAELESLRKLNPYQVLGVDYQTTDEVVRSHFGQLTRRYHPDRFARFQSVEARECASEIFILIRDAYRRLHDEASRTRTLAVLRNRHAIEGAEKRARAGGADHSPAPKPAAAPPPAPAPEPAATPAPAAIPTPLPPPPAPPTSRLAEKLFDRTRETDQGSAPVQVATPEKPRSRPDGDDIGLVETLLDDGKYEEALALYGIAARRDPSDRRAKVGIELAEGLRALAQRDRLEAAQRFEAVLELDPTNERAARELAEMRRQATNERKGLLARLLGKKE